MSKEVQYEVEFEGGCGSEIINMIEMASFGYFIHRHDISDEEREEIIECLNIALEDIEDTYKKNQCQLPDNIEELDKLIADLEEPNAKDIAQLNRHRQNIIDIAEIRGS